MAVWICIFETSISFIVFANAFRIGDGGAIEKHQPTIGNPILAIGLFLFSKACFFIAC